MKNLIPALKIYLFMTVLLGLIYPIGLTFLGQRIFPKQATGSLIEKNGKIIGSELIAQKFTDEKYFWPRPSAVDYNPNPSGGSNLSPTSSILLQAYNDRKKQVGQGAPQDLLFASASGLDPHIALETALYQIPRIAKARSLPEENVRNIIDVYTERRQLGFMGEKFVNVLKMNLSLDEQR